MNQSEQKTFVFLNIIGYLGGSQLYTLRKMRWLRSLGWKVVVIGIDSENLRIPEFDEFVCNDYPFLGIPAYLFSRKARDKYCTEIIRKCGLRGHVFFQSHSRNFATWAELLAEKTNGIHVCHLLEEEFGKTADVVLALMRFKLSQNALWGIYEKSIPNLLGKSDQTRGRALMPAEMPEGAVVDCSPVVIPKSSADYKILILGRCSKPYVRVALKSSVEFAHRHCDKKIAIYMMGTSEVKARSLRFDQIISTVPNLAVFWLGTVFPLPRGIFKIADVCLAATGSAQVACSEKCLCISIDVDDNMAIGLLGITTKNTLFRVDEPAAPIEDLLEAVLVSKLYKRSDIEVPDFGLDYAAHAKLLELPAPSDYYDFSYWRLNANEKCRSLVLRLFGVNGYLCLIKMKRWVCFVRNRLA